MMRIFQISFVVIISALIIKTFFLDSFVVSGDSMEPAFKNGDYLLVNKIPYYFYEPERGDVVVAKSKELNKNLIKRIIGLPGDRVEIKNGVIVIKDSRTSPGKILEEAYLPSGTLTPVDTIITLDKEEYFLMGDNRLLSVDSRESGPFNLSAIRGRVLSGIHFNPYFLLSQLKIFSK